MEYFISISSHCGDSSRILSYKVATLRIVQILPYVDFSMFGPIMNVNAKTRCTFSPNNHTIGNFLATLCIMHNRVTFWCVISSCSKYHFKEHKSHGFFKCHFDGPHGWKGATAAALTPTTLLRRKRDFWPLDSLGTQSLIEEKCILKRFLELKSSLKNLDILIVCSTIYNQQD